MSACMTFGFSKDYWISNCPFRVMLRTCTCLWICTHVCGSWKRNYNELWEINISLLFPLQGPSAWITNNIRCYRRWIWTVIHFLRPRVRNRCQTLFCSLRPMLMILYRDQKYFKDISKQVEDLISVGWISWARGEALNSAEKWKSSTVPIRRMWCFLLFVVKNGGII